VHPKAVGLVNAEADHTANIDVAEDNAPNYLQWIADRCRPHLGQRVLEVGAGTGSITARYAEGREVLAVERADWCIKEMERRFASSPNVTVRHADLAALADEGLRFDSVVLLNVLEHIEDDVAALESLRRLLVPGGRVVLYVPALNGLYGPFDRKAGHYRRYAPWRMRQVLAAAGLVDLLARKPGAQQRRPTIAMGQDRDRRRAPAGVPGPCPTRAKPLLRRPGERLASRHAPRRL
jgi:2-polyprenyl-3-methyl-5-hydroxy-6-metoxy-1,4-benzoquinol methylase